MRSFQEEKIIHEHELNWIKKLELREMKVREEMYQEIKSLQQKNEDSFLRIESLKESQRSKETSIAVLHKSTILQLNK